MKPKTDKERSAELAQRKRDTGQVRVSVSMWVLEEKYKIPVREAMRSAGERELKKLIKKSED